MSLLVAIIVSCGVLAFFTWQEESRRKALLRIDPEQIEHWHHRISECKKVSGRLEKMLEVLKENPCDADIDPEPVIKKCISILSLLLSCFKYIVAKNIWKDKIRASELNMPYSTLLALSLEIDTVELCLITEDIRSYISGLDAENAAKRKAYLRKISLQRLQANISDKKDEIDQLENRVRESKIFKELNKTA